MYRVSVLARIPAKGSNFTDWACIDAKGFRFGDWAEIGFWLDDCGYNSTDHRVEIVFTEGDN
jgi:hypothetical protein